MEKSDQYKQGRPLRVHEYTVVSPWFVKAYMCIEKLSLRVFQWDMTCMGMSYAVGKLLNGNFHAVLILYIVSP